VKGIGGLSMIDPCSSVIKKHHQSHYRILLSLVVWFIFCPLSFADWVPALKEIYGTPIPIQIRKNFDQTIQTHKTCSECALGILDGDKFINIYAKKFIVLSLSPNSFGGYWAFIAVEGELKHTFRLWLYDIDSNEYDLRSVEELSNSLDEEFISQLRNPAYRAYWL